MNLRVISFLSLAFALTVVAQAEAASTVCYTVAACVLGANLTTGSGGFGIEGQSLNSVGVFGVSSTDVGVYGRSTNYNGVVGETQSTIGGGSGVFGVDNSPAGTENMGVFGISARGTGVEAFTVSGTALVANAAAAGAGGIQSTAAQGVAIRASTVGGGAIIATAVGGTGIYASSQSNYAMYAASGSFTTLGLEADSTSHNAYLIYGFGAFGGAFNFDTYGNENLTGTLTQNGDLVVRTRSENGDVATYGARSSSPTLEDSGTARLTNGAAFVALDKTFASTIAPDYLIFVTPHGDSNSLYTVPSTAGFTVRESKGGRSTLMFDYRIVAKPRDAKGARLAALAPVRELAKPAMPKLRAPRGTTLR